MERIERIYALFWAMGYLYFARPVSRWWRRHRRDADYFAHMGWLAGLIASAIMIFWGTAQ